jgi:hypothetical protein
LGNFGQIYTWKLRLVSKVRRKKRRGRKEQEIELRVTGKMNITTTYPPELTLRTSYISLFL